MSQTFNDREFFYAVRKLATYRRILRVIRETGAPIPFTKADREDLRQLWRNVFAFVQPGQNWKIRFLVRNA